MQVKKGGIMCDCAVTIDEKVVPVEGLDLGNVSAEEKTVSFDNKSQSCGCENKCEVCRCFPKQ